MDSNNFRLSKLRDLPKIPAYVEERLYFNSCLKLNNNKSLQISISDYHIDFRRSRGFISSQQVKEMKQFARDSNDNPKEISEIRLKKIFKMTVAHLYREIPFRELNIVVGGEVASDGLGDYFQMLFISSLLKEKIPSAKLMLHTDLEAKYKNISKPEDGIIDLISFDHNPSDYKQKKIEAHLKSAHFLLSVSHGNLVFDHNTQKYLHVEENGMEGAPCRFGLGLNHRQDMGIAIKKPLEQLTLENLMHVPLRDLLKDRNPLFFGYLKEKNGGCSIGDAHRVAFITMAIASLSNDSSPVDIVTPFNYLGNEVFDLDVMNELNVGKFQLFKMDKVNQLTLKTEINLNENGRIVRIIDPSHLSNTDMLVLIKESSPLTGCTGDMSFSEVVSCGKLPLYQTMWQKEAFFKQITYITGILHPEEYPNLHQFFERTHALFVLERRGLAGVAKSVEVLAKESLAIGRACQNPALIEESLNFCAKLQKCYSSNEIFVDFLMRKLTHMKYPQLKIAEKEVLGNFMNDNQETLREAYQKLKDKIAPFNQRSELS